MTPFFLFDMFLIFSPQFAVHCYLNCDIALLICFFVFCILLLQAYTNELENKVSRLEEENERLKKQKVVSVILSFGTLVLIALFFKLRSKFTFMVRTFDNNELMFR